MKEIDLTSLLSHLNFAEINRIMSNLFGGDSDSEPEIKTDNEFAKNYDNWRRKEELNKLKTKYGDETLENLEDDDTSSSEDDEVGVEWTEEVEKDFFKTLSCLKNKDPRIYDDNVKFFDSDATTVTAKKKKKEKPLFLKDYERKMILEKGGKFSDEDDQEVEDSRSRSPTYVEEQKKLKDMFRVAGNIEEESSEDETGGVFKSRQKLDDSQNKEDGYKAWLSGKKDEIEDKEAEAELKPLKDYWNDPNLDEDEKYIRNYILNEKYKQKESEDHIPSYEEIVHDSDKDLSEDEKVVDAQEEFEHKYNFRFEEPDQDFIKRYPRTLENSVRKTDDKRKIKRAETKERKQKEKQQKMQELKTLQELKRGEIEEKIDKLKEITGHNEINFKDIDLDGDFDPDAHDRKMQALFNDEYYEGPEEEQKPEFPEFDEYLELENWDRWHGEDVGEEEASGPHCEDEGFNMDCDYDPTVANSEPTEDKKGKKKRKRKSLFAKVLSEPKPVFDPNDKTYEQYLDEYYKFNCEDIIGDTLCKFKYRKVVPNSFGLSVEEILTANDRELNKWCSLKKAIQHRPDHVEKYDQIAFEKKGSNIALKRRVLPSLFEVEKQEEDAEEKKETQLTDTNEVKNAKSKAGKKRKRNENNEGNEEHPNQKIEVENGEKDAEEKEQKQLINTNEVKCAESRAGKKRKRNENNEANEEHPNQKFEVERSEKDAEEKKQLTNKNEVKGAESKARKKKKRKVSNKAKEQSSNQKLEVENGEKCGEEKKQKQLIDRDEVKKGDSKAGKKRKRSEIAATNKELPNKKRGKQFKKGGNTETKVEISDARLSAYGINPKKFKNKIKFGNKK